MRKQADRDLSNPLCAACYKTMATTDAAAKVKRVCVRAQLERTHTHTYTRTRTHIHACKKTSARALVPGETRRAM